MEVNIEKIMDDIRAEIKEKGYTSDVLSFTDVTGKSTSRGETLTDCELMDTVETADSLALVPCDRPITGNPIAVFIKKIIRKFIRFYVCPTVDQQNEFNACVVTATEATSKRTVELTKKVTELEQKLETAAKENEELRQRLDRLEKALTDNGK